MKPTLRALVASVVLAGGAAEAHADACVSDALLDDVGTRAASTNPTAQKRWTAVLRALRNDPRGMSLKKAQAIHDRRSAKGWTTAHWVPVLDALTCQRDARAQTAQQPEPEVELAPEPQALAPTPKPLAGPPVITISGAGTVV